MHVDHTLHCTGIDRYPDNEQIFFSSPVTQPLAELRFSPLSVDCSSSRSTIHLEYPDNEPRLSVSSAASERKVRTFSEANTRKATNGT